MKLTIEDSVLDAVLAFLEGGQQQNALLAQVLLINYLSEKTLELTTKQKNRLVSALGKDSWQEDIYLDQVDWFDSEYS